MQNGYGGEAVEVTKRKRLRDKSILELRSRQMYVMRLQGMTMPEIAVFFSCTRQFVFIELKAIPEAEKRRIEGRFNRGQVA